MSNIERLLIGAGWLVVLECVLFTCLSAYYSCKSRSRR